MLQHALKCTEVVDTPWATVSKRGSIIWMVVKEGAEITLDAAKEIQAATREALLGEDKALLLSDVRHMKLITREARAHISGESSAQMCRAQALVVSSGFSRVLGNFLIGLNKTPYPTKVFTSEDEACAWLEAFAMNGS